MWEAPAEPESVTNIKRNKKTLIDVFRRKNNQNVALKAKIVLNSKKLILNT